MNTIVSKVTGFRLTPVTLARLKTKAKTEKVSLNTLVEGILSKSVEDILSEEEIAASRKHTEDFLSLCSGAWSGNEYDEVEEFINSSGTTSQTIVL